MSRARIATFDIAIIFWLAAKHISCLRLFRRQNAAKFAKYILAIEKEKKEVWRKLHSV